MNYCIQYIIPASFRVAQCITSFLNLLTTLPKEKKNMNNIKVNH